MINYHSQKLHTKLSTFLKFMVFRIIFQIKKAPTQVRRNTEVGNTLFSFEIPESISNMIDMDKLPHLEIATNLSERQLSFKERLEGWNIERRQRETGRFDVYYRHKKSKRVLRSIYEIVIFLMYESSPRTSQKKWSPSSSKRTEEGQDGDEGRLWGNDSEDIVELYKKLEDEAAENLISLCNDDDNDVVANNNEDKPPTIVDVASTSSSSSSSSVAANDDDAIDLINHIPICRSMEEVQKFLVNNRKAILE